MSNPAPDTQHGRTPGVVTPISVPALITRAAVGGVLMGLANLVPGLSGGTMLLAVGIYPLFIGAMADVTRLRFSRNAIIVLGTIAGSAVLAILLLAGTMRDLVVEQRWLMYSLFIGLTLGGVPLIWRLARPATPAVWIAAAIGFAVMAVMAFGSAGSGLASASVPMLIVGGIAGASAMILPGISGGYLLLLLGQYEPILGAVDALKTGLLESGGTADLSAAMWVLVPVGIGVLVGIVGVSNLLKWLLERFEKATLGVLLGLLVGAVVGLYPFQQPTRPEAGYVHDGVTLDELAVAALDEEAWPLQRFTPTAGQVAGALALVLVGFGATLLVDRIGRQKPDDRHERVAAHGNRPHDAQ
jgi:putative membrane protein